MKSHRVVIWVLVWTLLCAQGPAQAPPPADPPSWQAGVARRDVTPEEFLWLGGYAMRDRPAEGTLHPLWVKALALQDASGGRAVLVTSDLLGFPKGLSERICGRIGQDHGLERSRILLSSSHTHCGPVLKDCLSVIYPLDEEAQGRIERYTDWLEGQIVSVVAEAFTARVPCQISSGMSLTRFAVNRRNNVEAGLETTTPLKGPNDHAVPVLKISKRDDSIMALAFGYSCHATVLAFYQWCGDYPGFAQIELEQGHPGAMALFFAGCGADQNALPRRSVALARQYGRELAAAVDRAIEEPMTVLAPELKTAYEEVELALSPPPTRDELMALAERSTGFEKRAFLELASQLDQGEGFRTTYPYPVAVWRMGDQTIIALGGEVVVDYSILLKRMFGSRLIVMGYSNDLMAYIPSVRVLKEGGYEGVIAQKIYGLPSAWQDDVESRILNACRDLAIQVGVPPSEIQPSETPPANP